MMRVNRIWMLLALMITIGISAYGQRARVVSEPEKEEKKQTSAPIPQAVKVKYEGGIVGFPQKMDGTIHFDQINERLVFRNVNNKEVLSVPYKAMTIIYADTKSKRPTAATVAGSVPLPYGLNIPAWFVKKKYRYLTIQFVDPDTKDSGITSFKINDKELLATTLNALGESAKLKQRGTAYVRVKEEEKEKKQ
jgi:hypothetical protein